MKQTTKTTMRMRMRMRKKNKSIKNKSIKNKVVHKDIIYFFLQMINSIKLFHWKTTDYATHKATDQLYADLNLKIDQFVEVLLGKNSAIHNNNNNNNNTYSALFLEAEHVVIRKRAESRAIIDSVDASHKIRTHLRQARI